MATLQERLNAFRASQATGGDQAPEDPRQVNVPSAGTDTLTSKLRAFQQKEAEENADQERMQGYKDADKKRREDYVAEQPAWKRAAYGINSGMENVVQGVGNMMGVVDDDVIPYRKGRDKIVTDTLAGGIGEFTGEMAGLAPLGFIGKGVQGANALLQGAKALPTATKVLTGTVAGLEGAGAGAILANPNERGEGAALGAGAGLALNKAMAGLTRGLLKGVTKTSPESQRLRKTIKKFTGKEPFIPLTQARNAGGGALTAKTSGLYDIVSLLPSAKANLNEQGSQLVKNTYAANLGQAFIGPGGNPTAMSEKALSVLKETGDVQKALEAAKNMKKNPGFTPAQQILDVAARKSPTGDYTPNQLLSSVKQVAGDGDLGYAPFRETAKDMSKVLGEDLGKSTVAAREGYRLMAELAGSMPDKIPGLSEALASKSLQNFLMGNTRWQNRLKEAMASGSGKQVRSVMSDVRRAMSAQAAQEDAIDGYANPQGLVKEYAGKAADTAKYYGTSAVNALRGN